MKKALLFLFGTLIIAQGVNYAATSETASVFQSFKNAIISDVTNVVQTSATNAVNQVKLINYKNQLAQKQQELKDLEASNTNAFIKIFKRYSINKKIRELEADIAALEKTSATSSSNTK